MTSERAAALLNVEAFLRASGVAKSLSLRPGGRVLFTQGEPATSVFYMEDGAVTLSVISKAGKEAIVAIFGPGDFVGEGALAGQDIRIASAAVNVPTRVMEIQAVAAAALALRVLGRVHRLHPDAEHPRRGRLGGPAVQ